MMVLYCRVRNALVQRVTHIIDVFSVCVICFDCYMIIRDWKLDEGLVKGKGKAHGYNFVPGTRITPSGIAHACKDLLTMILISIASFHFQPLTS